MGNAPIAGTRLINGFPIFLLGSGRSGTTLLQKILNSAEDVMIWGEHGGFLKQIAEAYFFNLNDKEINRQIFKKNPVAKEPNLDFHRLKLRKIGYSWTNWYGKQELTDNFKQFVESFFNPHSLEKRHWGFKEIRYGIDDSVMDMLADIYRQARFVFIVRDPVDVLASQVAMGWDDEWKHLANKWAIQNQQIMDFCRENEDRVYLVKYEDLISRGSNTITDLFNWLGFAVSETQYDILDIEDGIWKKTRQDGMPHRTIFSKWRLRQILDIVKFQKRALGY